MEAPTNGVKLPLFKTLKQYRLAIVIIKKPSNEFIIPAATVLIFISGKCLQN
jgi:hypothetical protein